MTNVDRPTSMVFFHDFPGASQASPAADPGTESLDYLQARERSERSAAKRAQSIKARQVHQELAQHYAKKVRQAALAERAAGEMPTRAGKAQGDFGR